MADRRNAFCRNCRKHRDKVGQISKRGLCAPCGEARMRAAVVEINAGRGENYQRWARGMRAMVDQL